jgi:regulator of protease activity HflC (stomatin/prohibitin superfamily)
MFTHITINQNERGIVTRDGRPVAWLAAGAHFLWNIMTEPKVEKIDLDQGYMKLTPELSSVIPDGVAEEIFVGAKSLALVERDGLPLCVLGAGRYVLWQQRGRVSAEVIDTETVLTEMPDVFWGLVPVSTLRVAIVKPFERALLYINGALERVLGPGRHGINSRSRLVEVIPVDMRERELQISGQEVITRDKVSLRTNLIVKYRVTDAVRSVEATINLSDMVYSEAQMAARNLVGGITVDELLEGRHQSASRMREALALREEDWGIEVVSIDLKDVVLPGDMKMILNKVIEAEKQAAANLILRREETAATRSLANTAKVLQSNPVLMRLKEIEAMKEIADRIDQISIVAGGQDLVRLLPSLPELKP